MKIKKIIILSILIILFSFTPSFAQIDLSKYYDEVEFEGKTYYKRKPLEYVVFGTTTSSYSDDENIRKQADISEEIMTEYFNQFINIDDNDKKIESFYLEFTSNSAFEENGDFSGIVSVSIIPKNINSEYWNKYTNYIIPFVENPTINSFNLKFYTRFGKNEETNKYEIKYMDEKPENYEELVKQAKENGIDVENIDLKAITNISYSDEIEATSKDSPLLDEPVNTEAEEKQINNISTTIKFVSVISIILIILFNLIFVFKSKVHKKNK